MLLLLFLKIDINIGLSQCKWHILYTHTHRNGDGFVDREEFGTILQMTGEPVTEEDIDEMFGESDTNKDGKIDFDGKSELGGWRASIP